MPQPGTSRGAAQSLAGLAVPPAPISLASPPALPRGQQLAYGALGLPLAMAALPIYVHVPRLYAETSAISLSLLGALLLAARLADALVDPLLGRWSDRSAQRRRLIVAALPLLALGMITLLNPPRFGAPLWLLAALLLTSFAFSLISIAYQAWGAELGRDAGERTRLAASREGFGLLGVLLAAALPGLLSTDIAQGLSWLAWIFVALLLLLATWTLRGVAPGAPRQPASGAPLGELFAVLRDKRFLRLLALFVVNGIAAALPATLVLFFVADVLQAANWAGAFLALYFVSGVAFLPLWVTLARRVGRVPAWVASMIVASAAFSWAASLGAGDLWPFAAICLLSGAALGADLTLPAALLADITQQRSERRGESDGVRAGLGSAPAGAYFGWWTLVAKLNLALAAGLALPLLDLVGYRPGEPSSTSGLSALYGVLPIAFKSLAAALAWRWRKTLESTS